MELIKISKKEPRLNIKEKKGNQVTVSYSSPTGKQYHIIGDVVKKEGHYIYLRYNDRSKSIFNMMLDLELATLVREQEQGNDTNMVVMAKVTDLLPKGVISSPSSEVSNSAIDVHNEAVKATNRQLFDLVMKDLNNSNPTTQYELVQPTNSQPALSQPQEVTMSNQNTQPLFGFENRNYSHNEAQAIVANFYNYTDIPFSHQCSSEENFSHYLPAVAKDNYSVYEVIAMVQHARTDKHLLEPIAKEDIEKSREGWLRRTLDWTSENKVKTAAFGVSAAAVIGGGIYLATKLLGGSTEMPSGGPNE